MAVKEYVNCVSAASQRRMRKKRRAAEEVEALERGSRKGYPFPARSCCRRPQPGSPSHRWRDSHPPVGKLKEFITEL